MDNQPDAAEPEALVEIVKETVRHLIQQRPDTTEQEKQLQEVARAISRLEQMGMTVPDALRQLKMELAAKAGQGHKIEQQLKIMASGLAETLREIEKALGRSSGDQQEKRQRTRRQSDTDLPLTPQKEFENYIIQILKERGGSAQAKKVLDAIATMMEGKFLPGDLTPHATGVPMWRNRAAWERLEMVKKGILRSNSRRGYWELNEDKS